MRVTLHNPALPGSRFPAPESSVAYWKSRGWEVVSGVPATAAEVAGMDPAALQQRLTELAAAAAAADARAANAQQMARNVHTDLGGEHAAVEQLRADLTGLSAALAGVQLTPGPPGPPGATGPAGPAGAQGAPGVAGVAVSTGSANLGTSLLASATRDVTVPLTRPMPSAAWSPAVSVLGGSGVLGTLICDGVLSINTTGAVVRVRNTGLSSIAATAATIHVVALALT